MYYELFVLGFCAILILHSFVCCCQVNVSKTLVYLVLWFYFRQSLVSLLFWPWALPEVQLKLPYLAITESENIQTDSSSSSSRLELLVSSPR